MVVLMACESRAPRKCLLAIRVGAFVWPLAGMYPSVPGQRTGIAETLVGVSLCHNMNNDNDKYLPTPLTHVRLLASMYSSVHGESRSLNELFAAIRIVADVRPYPAVNSLYVTY